MCVKVCEVMKMKQLERLATKRNLERKTRHKYNNTSTDWTRQQQQTEEGVNFAEKIFHKFKV